MGRRRKTEETNPEVNNNTNMPEKNNSEVNSETTVTNSEPISIDMSNQELPENVTAGLSQVIDEEPAIVTGSKVKIKTGIGNDMIGRRIHNGIKNYVYTVLAVRSDDYCTIECLTYTFTLHKNDLILIK